MERWIKVIGQGWCASGLLLLSGCAFLKSPAPAALPAVVTSATPPKRATDIFDEKEGVTHWTATALNGSNDPTKGSPKPDKFQISKVDSGTFIWARSVKTVNVAPAGKPAQYLKTLGVPEEMHLAGIITPQPGQPGWAETVKKVQEWTMNAVPSSNVVPEVDIEQDPIFPQDLSTPHLRLVQVWFVAPNGKLKGKTLNLARMLVHTGYAVADINSPTSLDVKPWFNDEQFARNYIDDKTNKIAPLGLWAKGDLFAALAQRLPAPVPTLLAPKGAKIGAQKTATTRSNRKTSRGDHITITKTSPAARAGAAGAKSTKATTSGGGAAAGVPAMSSQPAASAPGAATTSSTSSVGNKTSP